MGRDEMVTGRVRVRRASPRYKYSRQPRRPTVFGWPQTGSEPPVSGQGPRKASEPREKLLCGIEDRNLMFHLDLILFLLALGTRKSIIEMVDQKSFTVQSSWIKTNEGKIPSLGLRQNPDQNTEN